MGISKQRLMILFLSLQEIAELQEKRLAAGREKVEAVSEARDAIRQEMQAEWDNLRQQLTQVQSATSLVIYLKKGHI